MDEEILRGQPDAPRLPLVLQSRHVEQTWWYMAPQRSDETEQMALRRVFWSMVLVYRQADENASEEVKAQASFNEKKLPSFLRSLQFAFDAEFSGRDSDMLGPDGYLPPGANQAGLPRLSSTAPGWKTR